MGRAPPPPSSPVDFGTCSSPSLQGQQLEVSQIVQIAQIKRVGNVIMVKSLMRSASMHYFQDFEWGLFQRVHGANTALQSLRTDLQLGDTNNCSGDELLFGPADENLAFWAMGAMSSKGWAVQVPYRDGGLKRKLSQMGNSPKRQKSAYSIANYEEYLADLQRRTKETGKKLMVKMND